MYIDHQAANVGGSVFLPTAIFNLQRVRTGCGVLLSGGAPTCVLAVRVATYGRTVCAQGFVHNTPPCLYCLDQGAAAGEEAGFSGKGVGGWPLQCCAEVQKSNGSSSAAQQAHHVGTLPPAVD